jgi:OOP family OmpA-OmpF porin
MDVVPAVRRWRTLVIALSFAAASCTDDGGDDPAVTEPPGESSTTATGETTPTTDDTGEQPALTDEQFEAALRQRLALPALPSFALPLDVFVDRADRELATRLEIPPGLYEGIAVVDARCDGTGEAVAADASGDFRGRDGSGTYAEGPVQVVVEGDGSGSFTDGVRSIVIESDGSGSYTGDGLVVEIESDGSGRYDDGSRVIEVDSDRSGSYEDDAVRIEVGSSGSATYRDDVRFVDVSPDGEIEVDGDDTHADVIATVLREGLPLFPPVPHVGEIPEPAGGASCGSVIRLDANVLFEFDSDALAPEADALLDRVAALLVALGSPPLRIDGHTDAVGSEDYNLDLSSRRAESVRVALVTRGVDGAALETSGLGESRPIAPNETPGGGDDPSGRRLNRRVELVLLDR